MTTRVPARRRTAVTAELDRRIAEAQAEAIVIWRGEQIRFPALRERIARIDSRDERDGLYLSYLDALEALNPLYEQRLATWAAADPTAEARSAGVDPAAMAVDLERFMLHSETSYFAALRRYLAIVGIEQGDATEADLWHVVRGTTWSRWFGEREVATAVTATGRPGGDVGDLDGWRAAEARLAGPVSGVPGDTSDAVARAYATLAGSPEWLVEQLGVVPDEAIAFVDFAAFVRLWRVRRLVAELMFELRLYASDDPAVHRAYFAGIVSASTGVAVAEQGYLTGLEAPFASARKLASTILAAMLVETLESRHGLHWWRDADAAGLVGRLAAAKSRDDALAELGYDALDWRPVLRQIRTRLIGEMSGYGGPNITTRAGTRKV